MIYFKDECRSDTHGGGAVDIWRGEIPGCKGHYIIGDPPLPSRFYPGNMRPLIPLPIYNKLDMHVAIA